MNIYCITIHIRVLNYFFHHIADLKIVGTSCVCIYIQQKHIRRGFVQSSQHNAYQSSLNSQRFKFTYRENELALMNHLKTIRNIFGHYKTNIKRIMLDFFLAGQNKTVEAEDILLTI